MNDPKNLPQVFLRAMEPEDLDLLYAVENDTCLWQVGTTNVPYSRYALMNFIANSTSDIYTDKQLRLMVENSEHEVVAIVDLMNFEPLHLRAEIGIVVREPFRHQGFAQATILQLLTYCRNVIHLHQVYAIVAKSNATSMKMLECCDFQENGRLSDWLFNGESYEDAYFYQRKL